MKQTREQQRAFSILEYTGLMVIMILAFTVFQVYIKRGFQGQIKKSGATFAFGREYAPHKSIDCAFDQDINAWFSTVCFDHEFSVRKCNLKSDTLNCALEARRSCSGVCAHQ